MKAAAITGIQKMKVLEMETPQITQNDEVLLKIKAVGICGSDIHYYNEGNIGSQVVEYPLNVGHEAAGEVVAVGKSVQRLKVGDKVAIEPNIFCGQCDQCLQDRRHTCRNAKFLGCPGQIDGCVSEYFVMPEKCCFKVNDSLPYALAAFAEPLSVGVYAVEMYRTVIGYKSIGVLGAGPIGQSVIASCVKNGGQKIFVTDKIDARLEIARMMGATWTGNPDKLDIKQSIIEAAPSSLDVVFECCGKQEAVDQAINILKPGGTLMMIGIPEVERISFQIDAMRRKEIAFRNVRRQNNCFEKAIAMIEQDPLFFEPLITHKYSIEDSAKGFETVRKYEDGVMKAVIEP